MTNTTEINLNLDDCTVRDYSVPVSLNPVAYIPQEYTGIRFRGRSGVDAFFRIICPCGVTDTFPLNGIPTVNTPQSCGNPKHWAIFYQEEAQ